MKQGSAEHFLPSRLFIYYNERAMKGRVREDAGAQIRDGIKTLAKQGACPPKASGPMTVPDSGGYAPVTCRSAENHDDGRLTDPANSHNMLSSDSLCSRYPS